MLAVTGLAWDSGGVTTGPVTVPLVLALGIGISRVVARDGESAGGGFGVVTLASLFPVLAVMLLGVGLLSGVPRPMSEAEFLAAPQREQAAALFGSQQQLAGYVLQHASPQGRLAFYGGDREALAQALRERPAGVDVPRAAAAEPLRLAEVAARNLLGALQAIIPLTLLFFGVLWLCCASACSAWTNCCWASASRSSAWRCSAWASSSACRGWAARWAPSCRRPSWRFRWTSSAR